MVLLPPMEHTFLGTERLICLSEARIRLDRSMGFFSIFDLEGCSRVWLLFALGFLFPAYGSQKVLEVS